jgi:hypothetical protein
MHGQRPALIPHSIVHRTPAGNPATYPQCLKLSAIGYQLSAISYRLSAISYQLSAISYQLSAISYQLSAISFRKVDYTYWDVKGRLGSSSHSGSAICWLLIAEG